MKKTSTIAEPVLNVHHLSVAGLARPRLDDVSVTLRHGEVAVLIGENGAGKTTFLDVVAGILPASEAAALEFQGNPLRKRSLQERAIHIASMPQRDEALGALSVERRILQGATPVWGSETLYDESHAPTIEALLEELQLLGLRNRALDELSGGERRRVHVARCLAHQRAKIFLLDEPFSGVDRGQASLIHNALRKRADEGALVVTSVHDLDLAAALADRILGFHEGKLLVDGPIQEAFTQENLYALYNKKGRLIDESGPQEKLFGVLFEP
ncbi:MAG: ABC transporter ATP-binding protein [Deltaproteobacteria bacterium]|nr:ABC transporter ATP-binding protein [Deltaproteobacteria bacterium]